MIKIAISANGLGRAIVVRRPHRMTSVMPKLTISGILEWFMLVSRADLDRALQSVPAVRSKRRWARGWAPAGDGT